MVSRLRIRDASNTADALVVTSIRGGTNPYLSSTPSGDGQGFDPITCRSTAGAYTGRIADWPTTGTDRIVTSALEDATQRQQLMDRRAFVEWSIDGGTTWTGGINGGVLIAGFLTGLRLISAAEYEYTVSDPTRAENNFTAFKPVSASVVLTSAAIVGATTLACQPIALGIASGTRLFELGAETTADASAGATSLSVTALGFPLALGASAIYSESIASFLTRWPNRGCILGGPVRGGFLDQPDRGGWEMIVEKNHDTFLRFNAGYAPPDFERSSDAGKCMGVANAQAAPLLKNSFFIGSGQATFESAANAQWADLVVEIVGVGFFHPTDGQLYDISNPKRIAPADLRQLCKASRERGLYVAGTTGTPSAGTGVRVRVLTAHVSESCPIFHSAHPVDWLATLWGEAGLSFSAAAIESVRDTIGAAVRYSDIITAPANLGQWLDANIYGPFGIGVRINDNGELEPFVARHPYAALPTVEITSADTCSDESDAIGADAFGIDRASAIRKVTLAHNRFIRTQETKDEVTFGYVRQLETVERLNGDPGAVGSAEASYATAGQISWVDAQSSVADFTTAVAQHLFDRYGRGLITGQARGRRGGSTDGAKLGDEIINKLPYLPNHNKRLGDDLSVSGRAMQIVRSTFSPVGPLLELADSGPNAQPYATAPTLSIAASTDYPRTVALVTITNAATLNGDGAGLRLQVAVTTGSTPLAKDYSDVMAFGAGGIPTGAITLPRVVAGRMVWVRAAATKLNKRPSSFSSVVSVTLTALSAPSSLSVTPSGTDGSIAAAAWTAGDATSYVDVYLRKSSDPSSANILQRTLPPSSVRFTLEGLTPGVSYTATVQDRDIDSGDTSAAITATFTAGATTATLPAPVSPLASAASATRSRSTAARRRVRHRCCLHREPGLRRGGRRHGDERRRGHLWLLRHRRAPRGERAR
jgi:hypothetical protein